MKIYQYRKNKNESIYFPDNWNISTKNNKIKFFTKGIGYREVSLNKVDSFNIPNMENLEYSYIKEIYVKYGNEVTIAILRNYKDIKCCNMILDSYITIIRNCKDTRHLDFLKRNLDFDVFNYRDRLIYFGIWTFPIIELDKHCKNKFGYTEKEHGSLKNFLKTKFNFKLEI